MSETEYEQFLNAICDLSEIDEDERVLMDQLRDDNGYPVPGCYRVLPAPTE